MNQEKRRTEDTTKRIILFLSITFGVTYLLEFFVVWPLVKSDSQIYQSMGSLAMAAAMFVPALGVLLTKLITKEGFKGNSYLLPKTGKKSIPYFFMGYFLPSICIILGAVAYFLIFPDKFDLKFGYMAAQYQALGLEITQEMLVTTVISQLILGFFVGPILNFVTCFGEEWGWRGYLLPKMQEKLPILPMLLINGVIWGVWHAPLTMIGHNYGVEYWGFPITGIIAMSVFCIVNGVIFSFLTIKTGSCIPAVFAHGALNGFASVGILFINETGGDPFLGPAPTGIIGGSAFILCAVLMGVLLKRDEDNKKQNLALNKE